jgi:UDP-arabinose 4-epimerase
MRNFVLVTGGAGYIGSHTCKQLAEEGYVPVSVDNLSRGHEWAVRWGPLERVDLMDGPSLKGLMEKYRPVAVMHFAALAYVEESVRDPESYYKNNLQGTLTLLGAMLQSGVKRIIFSSTCAIYGEPLEVPIREDHPQNPINPYGRSKLAIEWMLRDYCSAYGLRSVALRYFNAAGADPEGEIGEVHDPETHLIPLVLQAAKDERRHITIFGTDYDTPDGTCIRDYIHVRDLAQAHVLALKALEDRGGFHTYNLGNGRGFSVREVIETARQVTGRTIMTRTGPRRPGDPPVLVADSSHAMQKLGWRPEFDDLSDIIITAWRFILEGRSPRCT